MLLTFFKLGERGEKGEVLACYKNYTGYFEASPEVLAFPPGC